MLIFGKKCGNFIAFFGTHCRNRGTI